MSGTLWDWINLIIDIMYQVFERRNRLFLTSKSFKEVFVWLGILIACLSFVLLAPDVSFSQTSPIADPEPKNSIVAFYANAMNIDYDEAERRLNLQAEMSLVEEKLIEDEAYFASWMQHEPDFGLVVSFTTDDGEERIKKYLADVKWADMVMVQKSDITREEIASMRKDIEDEARKTDIAFGSGINYQAGKIMLYTEKAGDLESALRTSPITGPMVDRIEVVEEAPAVPANGWEYPFLVGGHPLKTCTTGFVVRRNSDSRRFISTSGHCTNNSDVRYNSTNAVYVGDVIWENDINKINQEFDDDLDFQVHEAAESRSFDLTNRINDGTNIMRVEYDEKLGTTNGDFVCKHGRNTGLTCGKIVDLSFSPGAAGASQYGTSDNYVRVNRYFLPVGTMGCPGDSGSPVFKYVDQDVWALGILSGTNTTNCSIDSTYFFYSPIDYINWSPFRILTADQDIYQYQNVWWSSSGCTTYWWRLNEYGNQTSTNGTLGCQTSLPSGSSGTVRSYTAYVLSNHLHEAMWRDTKGWVRSVPLKSNGSVNWSAAPNWFNCCNSSSPPEAQGVFIVGDTYRQNVWWSASNCEEFSNPLNDDGSINWGSQTSGPCQTSLPPGSSGSIESYTAYVTGELLRESIWRGGKGYVRDVPLDATNTNVNWPTPATAGWTHCCTASGPKGQGAYVISYP